MAKTPQDTKAELLQWLPCRGRLQSVNTWGLGCKGWRNCHRHGLRLRTAKTCKQGCVTSLWESHATHETRITLNSLNKSRCFSLRSPLSTNSCHDEVLPGFVPGCLVQIHSGLSTHDFNLQPVSNKHYTLLQLAYSTGECLQTCQNLNAKMPDETGGDIFLSITLNLLKLLATVHGHCWQNHTHLRPSRWRIQTLRFLGQQNAGEGAELVELGFFKTSSTKQSVHLFVSALLPSSHC